MNKTRASIVQYLRVEAATLLWDSDDLDDLERIEDAVTLLEAYADAIEDGEDIEPDHPLLRLS